MSTYAIGLAALGVTGITSLVGALTTRRSVPEPPPELSEWFRRWQVQHNAPDINPADTTALRIFLTLTYRIAKPLARLGILPTAITVLGLWLACTVPVLARQFPVLAAIICALSSILDGVDGAVAGLSNRATPLGFVLDSVVDRLTEVAFFGALAAAGAHGWAAATAWFAVVLLEYMRARAGNAGLGEVGVVTIAERPTRVLCVVFGLLGAAALPRHARAVADAACLISVATTTVGLGQLWHALIRLLTSTTPPR